MNQQLKPRKRIPLRLHPLWRGTPIQQAVEQETLPQNNHLTNKADLQEIVHTIAVDYAPTRIILLGHINTAGECFSIFNDRWQEPADLNAAYLLLEINLDNSERQSIYSAVEQRFRKIIDISCIIHSSEELKHLVKNQNRLAIRALQSGKVLYQKWAMAPHLQEKIQAATFKNIDNEEVYAWYQRSGIFYQTASIHLHLGNYGMAAFCLHQATEQLLTMLHLIAVGYKMAVHNLDRLLRSLRFFYREVATRIMNRTQEEEKKFHYLNNLYVNYRYRHNLQVSIEDIQFFFQELREIQSLADRTIHPYPKIPNIYYPPFLKP